jgi:hypothetical protein
MERSRPWPLLALVPTNRDCRGKRRGGLYRCDPFLFRSSMRLTHNTTRSVISIVWSTKLRFRSRQVGVGHDDYGVGPPKQIKSRAIFSSAEFAIRE